VPACCLAAVGKYSTVQKYGTFNGLPELARKYRATEKQRTESPTEALLLQCSCIPAHASVVFGSHAFFVYICVSSHGTNQRWQMVKHFILKQVLHKLTAAVFAFVLCSSQAAAYRDGISGRTQIGCGGSTCHGSQPSTATTITLIGDQTVDPNTVNTFTLQVQHSSQASAGFNLAAFDQNGQPAGTLQYPSTENPYVKLLNGELTHRNRRTMSGTPRTAKWQVQWRSPSQPGIYTIRAVGNATNSDGRANAIDEWNYLPPVTIVVRGIIVTAPAQSMTVCAGDTITLEWTSYGITSTSISYSTNNGTSWTTITAVDTKDGTNRFRYPCPTSINSQLQCRFRLMNADNDLVYTDTPDLTIVPRTTIRTQPTSPPAQCEGGSVSLSITASGGNLRYQWKLNGTAIPGATAPQLQLSNLRVDQSGNYLCEVTGACGSVTSNAVTLTVKPKPTITSQSADTTISAGGRLELYVVATPDTGCTYQWYKNGAPISGATGSRYILESTSTADAGTYAVQVSNACGTEESAPIRVQVSPAVSVEDGAATIGARLYPQPAVHRAVIESPLPITHIVVYDAHGRLLRRLECQTTDASKVELPLQDERGSWLPHGMYLVGCLLGSPATASCQAPNATSCIVWLRLLIE